MSDDADETQNRGSRFGRYSAAILIVGVFYIFSSGPVLAGACWLREATDQDAFYLAFWLYGPLLFFRCRPLDAYVTWWFWLFDTVGPG
jgi:hypothetical protein